MDWQQLATTVTDRPWAVATLSLAGIFAIAWASLFIARRVLVVGILRFVAHSSAHWDDRLVDAQLFARLAHLAPALVVRTGVPMVPGLDENLAALIGRLAVAVIVLVVALSISAFLNAINDIYSGLPEYADRPIKSYLQLIKLVLGVVAAVLIVAAVFDRSPLIFLSGLGAMAAVLLLVFRDTILSLVASVQLTTNDMIRVGDWIEMPQYRADGDVVDIALHTISIQNWDKTITTIPTHKFIEDSFRNWRGMSLSGGRRIKRALWIDMNTIRFLEPDEIDRFGHMALLRDYIADKSVEIGRYNAEPGRDASLNADIRRLTNVGTFRAYINHYLRSHPKIHREMTLIVRQLEPGPSGLPIEIYCFTNDTDWAVYEGVQSDIIDHLLAVASDFGLRAFQNPSGHDLAQLGAPARPDEADPTSS